MTKLGQWLSVLAVFTSIWLSLITNKSNNNFTEENYRYILYSPIFFVGVFGLYALITVLYRVFTFNNCEEAAAELQKEIQEAKADLTTLGFKFKEVTK